jgi:hypothetical protein
MSKRFNYDDEEFKDEDFPDVEGDGDEELNAEYLAILEKRELIEAIKLQIIQKELNFAILVKTIRYLEKTWFWGWKSLQSKLNLIVETYQTFKALADIDAAQYQEEEQKESE